MDVLEYKIQKLISHGWLKWLTLLSKVHFRAVKSNNITYKLHAFLSLSQGHSDSIRLEKAHNMVKPSPWRYSNYWTKIEPQFQLHQIDYKIHIEVLVVLSSCNNQNLQLYGNIESNSLTRPRNESHIHVYQHSIKESKRN